MASDAFRVSVQVSGLESGLSQTVDALVGGGGAIAVMPASMLHSLGIRPEETMHFRTEDGGRAELPVGHAWFSVEGAEGEAMVVFGPEDRCELGANTLSDLLLEPDLATHSLFPVMGLGLLPGIFLVGDSYPNE